MAWDEDPFPVWLPAETIVTAALRTASPIPRITEDSSAAATCPLGADLTGGATCFSRKGSGWSALAGPSGGGVGYPTHPRVRIRKEPVAGFLRPRAKAYRFEFTSLRVTNAAKRARAGSWGDEPPELPRTRCRFTARNAAVVLGGRGNRGRPVAGSRDP